MGMKAASESALVQASLEGPMTEADITGVTFHRLKALAYAGRKKRSAFWFCLCECGNRTIVRAAALKNGNTKSCGCLSRETASRRASERNRRHGMRYTPEYQAWKGMIGRCHRPSDPAYPGYGGRGIVVCEEWRSSFVAFFSHIGPRPSPQHSLDRLDNDKGYEPGNVRWATRVQQQNNRRMNHRLTWNGQTMTVTEWSRQTDLSVDCIIDRLGRGWPMHLILTVPARTTKMKRERVRDESFQPRD
jgi:hypothetical protein